jgi:hypothetical protein
MPPRRDYSEFHGKKFGKWTIIRDAPDKLRVGSDGRTHSTRCFYCVCECGKKQAARVPDVLSGKSSRCLDCKYTIHGENCRKYNLKPRYGQWTVLNKFNVRKFKNHHANLYVRCKCSCGKVKDIACHQLRGDRTTMCASCARQFRDRKAKDGRK